MRDLFDVNCRVTLSARGPTLDYNPFLMISNYSVVTLNKRVGHCKRVLWSHVLYLTWRNFDIWGYACLEITGVALQAAWHGCGSKLRHRVLLQWVRVLIIHFNKRANFRFQASFCRDIATMCTRRRKSIFTHSLYQITNFTNGYINRYY